MIVVPIMRDTREHKYGGVLHLAYSGHRVDCRLGGEEVLSLEGDPARVEKLLVFVAPYLGRHHYRLLAVLDNMAEVLMGQRDPHGDGADSSTDIDDKGVLRQVIPWECYARKTAPRCIQKGYNIGRVPEGSATLVLPSTAPAALIERPTCCRRREFSGRSSHA